jgi:hypothetical protein
VGPSFYSLSFFPPGLSIRLLGRSGGVLFLIAFFLGCKRCHRFSGDCGRDFYWLNLLLVVVITALRYSGVLIINRQYERLNRALMFIICTRGLMASIRIDCKSLILLYHNLRLHLPLLLVGYEQRERKDGEAPKYYGINWRLRDVRICVSQTRRGEEEMRREGRGMNEHTLHTYVKTW